MSVGRKILLVDDDVALRHSLAEQLRLHEEFLPEEAEDGAKALALVGQQYFDAILLDVGLPDMDGRELCRLMRRSGVRAPIVMLTGADTDADAILGLGRREFFVQAQLFGQGMAQWRVVIDDEYLAADRHSGVPH